MPVTRRNNRRRASRMTLPKGIIHYSAGAEEVRGEGDWRRSGGTVARIACELIIHPSAQPSLLGNHNREAASVPVQVATLRAVAHPCVRSLVLSLSTILPRRRRDDARARTRRGSLDRVPSGTALRPRN